ncbi:MAG: uroporphyrinogen decarboxylase family protein [Verrucomicrobia bacterium]|jgi:uroporphyrinogen decarboxylase|nr:uroporphyrinogen decarboxylase family protein [Verrucomicrobiota bacterium]MDI9381054.1 uroporphyrinogen decarboxylase family protein [Verrucomicrobiota bacterium]NMD20817.1 methylcobamide--CoM methyltransferase [Verrucomicrobiota bacterium]HNU98710.1 uroporphyrinogen decarboxylase family protein [Verrucomicrobiota bacterium]HOA61260.1 uroporphyrinogen decarboxylase family protein [Verrucomicrobiota bacterium]
MSALIDLVFHSDGRFTMPILTYPGAPLVGATVRQMVTDPKALFEVLAALHRKFATPVVLTAMDLSVESEAFGCEVAFADHEVPTVVGRLVTTRGAAERLAVPEPGAGRTRVYLETARRLRTLPGRPLVLASMLGPFSLAARLYGVSEALGLTIENTDLAHLLLEKATAFLAAYAKAFKAAGADGLVMAEPTAGLLSPRAMIAFSSAYIRRIVESVDDDTFTLILHNCAAKLIHLDAALQAGARVFHFGAPMDLPGALAKAPSDVVLAGNLDPSGVFARSTPEQVRAATRALLDATRTSRNYVLSSGCDIPPQTPIGNIEAFFAVARGAAC